MRIKVLGVAFALALTASACRQDQPVSLPSPTRTPSQSPSPSSSPDDTFTLEGSVVNAWGTSAMSAGQGPSPDASSAASGSASPAGSGAAGASPGQQDTAGASNAGSGALTVNLSSYFSETECRYNPGDLLVVRFTPATAFQLADLTNDASFPQNLEGVRLTVSGQVAQEPGSCLPVADNITLLEGSSPAASPQPTQTAGRPRARTTRTTKSTPSPTPSSGATGNSALPGGSSTGLPSSTGLAKGDHMPASGNQDDANLVPPLDENSGGTHNNRDTTNRDNGQNSDTGESGNDADNGAGGT